jgi:Trypsin-like peptidase domain
MTKKHYLFILCFVWLNLTLRAQYSIPEVIVTGASLVQAGNSTGSGFFIQDSLSLYFVTARHVIMNEGVNPITKKIEYRFMTPNIEIRWYARKAEESVSNLMIINAEELMKSGNLVHGTKIEEDFVVARIAQFTYVDSSLSLVNYSTFVNRPGASSRIEGYPIYILAKFSETNIGDEVIMVGYPKSLGLKEIPQYDFNRPLIRKGLMAGKDIPRKNLIIDCPSYGGNSGGAVFAIKDEGFQSSFYLAGIVSSFIPLQETWINPSYGIQNSEFSNSGYSVVIPIEKVNQQIAIIEKRSFK